MASPESQDDTMTMEERMAYLRERGIEISTPDERKASATAARATNTVSTGRPSISYVLLPADTSKPLQELTFPSPLLEQGGVATSDPLAEHLRAAFKQKGDRADLSLLQKGTTDLFLGSAGAPTTVSDAALQEVAAQGNVEVFALVHGCPSNDFTTVNIYLDEAGMLKRLPLNPRATNYAKVAGFNPPPQFYGDVFLGRVQRKPFVRQLSFCVGEDTAMDAAWLRKAADANLEHQLAKNRLTGRNERQPDIAGQDGKEKVEEGYSWTQTEEELELNFALPVEASSKEIHVKFGQQLIQVEFQKKSLSVVKLFQRVDVDSGTWVLEKAADKRKLVVTVEKTEEGFWPRIED
jgi:CS domain